MIVCVVDFVFEVGEEGGELGDVAAAVDAGLVLGLGEGDPELFLEARVELGEVPVRRVPFLQLVEDLRVALALA